MARAMLNDLLSRLPQLDTVAVTTWWESADKDTRRHFITYASEALFAERVLAPDLESLTPGSTVVEIGSGIGLLSHLIAARGHRVVAYEPEGAGFTAMRRLFDVAHNAWVGPAVDIDQRWEPFDIPRHGETGTAQLVVAFNVIEHVPDPARMVQQATLMLAKSPNSRGRFVCPNYRFPYEPHFGFPTLVSKRFTYRVVRRRIVTSELIGEPERFWADLSWPTLSSLHRDLAESGVPHSFGRHAALTYVKRLREAAFLERKGAVMKSLGVAVPVAEGVLRRMPLRILPIIDLTTRTRLVNCRRS